jgi:hypothetical protein
MRKNLMVATAAERLPSAMDLKQKIALAEAEEASRLARKLAEADAERRALIDELSKPVSISDDEAIGRAIKIIERAVADGRTEAQVYRFPSKICTDRGRAINQQEKDWGNTLVGVPKQIFDLWRKYFQPRGYKLTAEIITFVDGMPGDIAMTLKWD